MYTHIYMHIYVFVYICMYTNRAYEHVMIAWE